MMLSGREPVRFSGQSIADLRTDRVENARCEKE